MGRVWEDKLSCGGLRLRFRLSGEMLLLLSTALGLGGDGDGNGDGDASWWCGCVAARWCTVVHPCQAYKYRIDSKGQFGRRWKFCVVRLAADAGEILVMDGDVIGSLGGGGGCNVDVEEELGCALAHLRWQFPFIVTFHFSLLTAFDF